MKINNKNQLGIVISSSTLLTGIGPSNQNLPISIFFILLFLFINFIQNNKLNITIKYKSLFILPLLLLFIIFSLGFIFTLEGLNPIYIYDRLIMTMVFIIYSIYLIQFSIDELVSGAVKACLIILPIYILETLLIIISPNLLINLRQTLGLRSIYLKGLLNPLLGHHEPSHMAITVIFILFVSFVLRKYYKISNKTNQYIDHGLNFLLILALFYFSGTYISTIALSFIITFFTLFIRLLNKRKILKIDLIKTKNLVIMFVMIIALYLSGFNYIFNKINISKTGDISTITRSYIIFRSVSDLKRTIGLGSGPGTYEKETKKANQFVYKDFKFLNKFSIIGSNGMEKAYLNNEKIPYYSIVGKITSELGIIGFALISTPFLFVIFSYLKKIVYMDSLNYDLIKIYFFTICSYLIMVAGGLRASIIQWAILIISSKLLRNKEY